MDLIVKSHKAQHSIVYASIFEESSLVKPRISLVAATTKVVTAETADSLPTDTRKEICVPIRGDDSVALLDYPPTSLPLPKLTLDFTSRLSGSDIHVVFKSVSTDSTTLRASVFESDGSRKSLTFENIEAVVLERLFRPNSTVGDVQRTPVLPGELPIQLQSRVADFWQQRVRCNVIPAVCAPKNTSSRPLAFENIVARDEGSPKRLVLRCTLHPSSVECACPMLHGDETTMWKRYPAERFIGHATVDLVVAMCGRQVGPSKICKLHGQNTKTVSVGDDVELCCVNTTTSLSCSHSCASSKKRRISGLFLPDLNLNEENVEHARRLLATCGLLARRIAPKLGHETNEQIELECAQFVASFDATAPQTPQTPQSDALETFMQNQDELAVSAIKSRDVFRHKRNGVNGTKDVLIRVLPQSQQQLKGVNSKLANTHSGFFATLARGRAGRG